uniref:Cytochrome P450 n=1 Tax=Kalanchoe fedtschenkoi TaxID=63787 RepID=A0A7N1A6Q8_KALFE
MDSTVTTATLIAALLSSVLILTWAYQVINWLWLTPKRLERSLKRQGVRGGSYRILYGDMKENLKMMQEAKSKPIGLSESIVPRLLPYVDQCLKTYGNSSIMWLGPKPRILVMEPELIKDIFNKISEFHKPKGNPLTRLLATGVATYEDDKWVKHRKLINPTYFFFFFKNPFIIIYKRNGAERATKGARYERGGALRPPRYKGARRRYNNGLALI